ncbi:MAG: ABC transporter substrate-binding protein [Longimicrobiales bacterium]
MNAGVKFSLAIVATLAVASCRGDIRSAGDSNMVRVRAVLMPYVNYAPLHVAAAEGMFAKRGIDIELVRMPDPEPALPLLLSGSVDVLPGHASPGVLNAIARGQRIRAVAQKHHAATGCSGVGIVVGPSFFDEWTPGHGRPPVRRISINRQGAMLYFVHTALTRLGLDLDSLETVLIPHAAEAAAFADGAIDAALSGDPFLSDLLAKDQARLLIGVEDVLPGIEFAQVYFGERLLDREPAVGVRFLAAWLEAANLLAEGPTPENLERVAAATGQPVETLSAVCWPFAATDGTIDFNQIDRFQRWLLEEGLIDRFVSQDELIDNAPLEAIRRSALDETVSR